MEPSSKRQCWELWYKINTLPTKRLRLELNVIIDLIEHLQVEKNCTYDNFIVKHKGNTLDISDSIPKTTAETPVVIISEVGKFC